MQISSSPEQLGMISKIFKDFGVLQTLGIILSGVGIYGLYKFILTKLELLKSGKDRELEELRKEVSILKEKSIKESSEYTKNLENINRTISKELKNITNFQEDDLLDLNLHPFFSNLKYWINIKIPQTNIKNKTKRSVFVDYMTIKFFLQLVMWQEYISNTNLESKTVEQLESDLMELNTRYAIELNKEIANYKLPQIVIDKFQEIWNIYDSLYISFIYRVLSSTAFETNYDKLYVILDSLLNINEVLLLDFVTKIDSLNGELENANYVSNITIIKKSYE